MNRNSLLLGVIWATFLLVAGDVFATTTFANRLDNWCAKAPIQATAPQQSRPFAASGSSCSLCHASSSPSSNDLNALGTASMSCTGTGTATTCGAAVNPFCIAHPPSGVSITAPPVGTTVSQGASLTFTGATASNPDGFPLSYNWLFTGGMPNATGQSVSVPMTVAGSIVSTLQVMNSVGMLATGAAPTRSVTVTATVPTISVAPGSLTFTSVAGGSAPPAQTLSVTSSGAQVGVAAAAATTTGGNWLSVSPTTAATPSTLTVAVNPAGLAPGTYNGTVILTSAGASNSPITVPVTFTVTALPTLAATPSALSFSFSVGGPAPATQTLSIVSSGAQLSFNASAATASGGNWLSVSPTTAATPSTLTVAVNPAGLAPGIYSGTVTITSTGASNSPITVPVSFTVTAAIPVIGISPTSLVFSTQTGGPVPGTQTLAITSSGAQVVFSAAVATSSGGSWLSVSPASSNTPATLTVAVNPAGLSAGIYSGTVTITSAGASNSPITVPVTFTVTAVSGQPVATIVSPAINVSVLPGESVSFRGSGTDPAGLSLRYKWTFSGGSISSSTRQNPGTVRFRNPGVFTVTLVVTNSKGIASQPAVRVITVAARNGRPHVDEDCLHEHDD